MPKTKVVRKAAEDRPAPMKTKVVRKAAGEGPASIIDWRELKSAGEEFDLSVINPPLSALPWFKSANHLNRVRLQYTTFTFFIPSNPLIECYTQPRPNKTDKPTRQAFYAHQTSLSQYYAIEPSPSARSKCRICHKSIPKDVLRFTHVVCNDRCFLEKKTGVPDGCGRFHLECFLGAQKGEGWEGFRRSHEGWVGVPCFLWVVGVGGRGWVAFGGVGVLGEEERGVLREGFERVFGV
ncbi:hypothetical protein HDV00_009093 [Rhizophlyctis rosea]|nr:hypothetical protein HDV00_009093 [Rhizophlyctis rosea]